MRPDPVVEEPTPRGGIEGYPTGLSWHQHHRVARVVASAATDATDCARLLAALGVDPADGLPASSPSTTAAPDRPAGGVRRKRSSGRQTRG